MLLLIIRVRDLNVPITQALILHGSSYRHEWYLQLWELLKRGFQLLFYVVKRTIFSWSIFNWSLTLRQQSRRSRTVGWLFYHIKHWHFYFTSLSCLIFRLFFFISALFQLMKIFCISLVGNINTANLKRKCQVFLSLQWKSKQHQTPLMLSHCMDKKKKNTSQNIYSKNTFFCVRQKKKDMKVSK